MNLILIIGPCSMFAQLVPTSTSNWRTYMASNSGDPNDICVYVSTDSLVEIDLIVPLNRSDIGNYPEMALYFRSPYFKKDGMASKDWYFDIDSTMIEETSNEDYPFQAFVNTISINVAKDCIIQEENFCLDISMQLVMKVEDSYIAYPVGLYNGEGDLFPSSMFFEADNTGSCSMQHTTYKAICCSEISIPSETCNSEVYEVGSHICRSEVLGFLENGKPKEAEFIDITDRHSTQKIQMHNSISLFPNPFSNELSIDIDLEGNNEIGIQQFDRYGRWQAINTYLKAFDGSDSVLLINTTSWPIGVNYLKICIDDRFYVFKTIKI